MSDKWEKLLEEIEKVAVDGKLTCTQGRALAEDLGISYANITKAADEKKIKIYQCELGCF